MRYYSSRNESSDDLTSVIRIVVSCVVIFISFFTIFVVIKKVTEIKIFEEIHIKDEGVRTERITIDIDNSESQFVTDEKGLKFRKEDKAFAREEWIDKNGELFYFDTAGYGITGELKKDGQICSFENGKLKKIRRDTSYARRAVDELFSSLQSNQYLVWLESEKNEEGHYAIKYRIEAEEYEDYLGSINDKQYASPNMIKINKSYIYYLALGKDVDYEGRLYRMRPGAYHKESVGIGVSGYIVLSDEVVYYYDGQRVIKAKNWNSIDVDVLEGEEAELMEALNKLPVATTSNIIDTTDYRDDEKKELNIFELPIPDKKVEIETTKVDTKREGNIVVSPFIDKSENVREIDKTVATPIVEPQIVEKEIGETKKKIEEKTQSDRIIPKDAMPKPVRAPGEIEIKVGEAPS